ncbi:MAG TPA: hypothetical protein VJZ75_01015 [Candidatus Bathyarchaeia archaeon]|nr:hypothetical protein [Candidatus Bathyarchaeia archaeon]
METVNGSRRLVRPEEAEIEIRARGYYYRLPYTRGGLEMAIRALKMIQVPDKKPAKQP